MDSSSLDYHLIHGFMDPEVTTPFSNGISIGSAVLIELTNVTDRHTDRHTADTQTDHTTPSVL